MPDPIKLSDRRQCQACVHWTRRRRIPSTGECAVSGLVTFCDATCRDWRKKARKANG